MFAGVGQLAALQAPGPASNSPRKILPPTPVVFPSCTPQTEDHLPSPPRGNVPLVTRLQTIHRPTDIQLAHFDDLKVHVISDASARDILPDPSFLPPTEEWLAVHPDQIGERDAASKRPISNGNLSPGLQTYIERRSELSIDNTAAFRTIQRIPHPAGEQAVRLGNAYAFFKNLEILAGYWHDTSLPGNPDEPSEPTIDQEVKEGTAPLEIRQRLGTGSQLPAEHRQQLITAFIKLVAYDFGCNVSFARCEPRLHLTPSTPGPPSSINSSALFIYRTPTDRASARAGLVDGPVAAVSSRTTTVFATALDSRLDLGRELVAALLTAQQRAREGRSEQRPGEGKWWTTTPRWGGGAGGPIGREADKPDKPIPDPTAEKPPASFSEVRKAIGGINGPAPGRRGRRGAGLQAYENYRRMLPPVSTWDRKARYQAIGKAREASADDIFLVSALNHHVSIVRVRVPDSLLRVLDGEEVEWERTVMWRSRWFDLFLKDDRIEAMELIWGMMAWSMRSDGSQQVQES